MYFIGSYSSLRKIRKVKSEVAQVVSNPLQPHGLQPSRFLCPWDFPGNSTGVDCHFLLQGIFPTQGSNPGLPHCRQMLYCLSHQGSPIRQLLNQENKQAFSSLNKTLTNKWKHIQTTTLSQVGDQMPGDYIDMRANIYPLEILYLKQSPKILCTNSEDGVSEWQNNTVQGTWVL